MDAKTITGWYEMTTRTGLTRRYPTTDDPKSTARARRAAYRAADTQDRAYGAYISTVRWVQA